MEEPRPIIFFNVEAQGLHISFHNRTNTFYYTIRGHHAQPTVKGRSASGDGLRQGYEINCGNQLCWKIQLVHPSNAFCRCHPTAKPALKHRICDFCELPEHQDYLEPDLSTCDELRGSIEFSFYYRELLLRRDFDGTWTSSPAPGKCRGFEGAMLKLDDPIQEFYAPRQEFPESGRQSGKATASMWSAFVKMNTTELACRKLTKLIHYRLSTVAHHKHESNSLCIARTIDSIYALTMKKRSHVNNQVLLSCVSADMYPQTRRKASITSPSPEL